MFCFTAHRIGAALVSTALVLAASAPAQAIVLITGDSLAIAEGYTNDDPGTFDITIEPENVLDLGSLMSLPLEATSSISLGTDRGGGSVSLIPGESNLILVQVGTVDPNVAVDSDWTTVIGLGDVVSHSGFGQAHKFFPDGSIATGVPASLYRYVRVIFQGEITSHDGIAFTANVQAVPEPGTLAMVLAGIMGAGFMARRRLG